MTPDITTKKISSSVTAAMAAPASPTTNVSSLPSLPRQRPVLSSSALPLQQPQPPTSTLVSSSSSSIVKRHLLTIEKLRNRVHQILKCVINLHIDILVLESNVNQLLDDVKELNADLMEVQRLDNLIQTLRDYNGPTICHEWPFPLVIQGTIDEADLAQTLNTTDIFTTA